MSDNLKITPELLLNAYCSGIFPMAEDADTPEVFWLDPSERGIIPLEGFHVSRSLKKRLLSGAYRFTANVCFDRIVDACAGREKTWINTEIRQLYSRLHIMGYAHSIEVWSAKGLIGGLYGVCIGGAFFGESMFSRDTDGSKLALVALVARLNYGGFRLLDTQFLTDHLATMGGIEIPKKAYHERLEEALQADANFWALPDNASPQELWQLSTQTS